MKVILLSYRKCRQQFNYCKVKLNGNPHFQVSINISKEAHKNFTPLFAFIDPHKREIFPGPFRSVVPMNTSDYSDAAKDRCTRELF